MEQQTKRAKITFSGIRNALRLYQYAKPYRWQFGLGLIMLLLSSAASLAFPKLLGDLIDTSHKGPMMQHIQQIGLVLIAVLILQSTFSYFRIRIFVSVTEKTLAALRQATYSHLIKLPMKFFAERRVGELNSRISSDISQLQDMFTTTLAEFLRQVLMIIGGIILLALTSGKLTLFMLAILPVICLLAVFFGKFIRRFSKQVQAQVAESNTIVEETLQGIFNVKAFANEYFEIGRYRTKTNEAARTGIKAGVYQGAFVSFIILGLFGAMVAVIWKGALMMSAGELEVGQLFSFILYSGFIGGSISGLAEIYTRIQKAIGASENLLEIHDEPTEDIHLLSAEQKAPGISGDIRFESVSFSYPSRKDIPVLQDVSFHAQPGWQVALVGPSGAGKSTIVSLLLRFYDPANGAIFFDGKTASAYDLSVLRNQMAVVPQDVFLFGGTILENIAYGDPHATEEQIMEAAKKANAWEFIQKFPEGLQTIVGERGVQLSGGQRQRIAIARAVLKDPRILILDEATSALDSESERLVQDALDKLMQGRTSIVIAHRLSTVRRADMILVMDKGMIVEEGTHEELMVKDEGLYKGLSELQFTV
ncbi:ABC transporter ATP-binding protein [Chitinophaga niabensis]|uniref:ABC-type multidrug transport system, ATPase and permease component n=1 Tax=Chitinophaga niabensis TaxID=536979 RepID=A0A1N6E6L7_9BACT|nr:ABC transporter transmembrane domain-containing protein [Chitinophaga niabensis]SIN78631.1 ABC-type multidrug transport system, ATPase and permease component [Chitinophaga niabensis]